MRKSINKPSPKDTALSLAMLEAAHDGLIVLDSKGFIQRFNRAAEQYFGYLKEELIDKNFNILLAGNHRPEEIDFFIAPLRPNNGKTGSVPWELKARRKNGEVFPVELGISEIHIGRKRLFVCNLRDITLRKEQEEQIEKYCIALATSEERYKLAIEGLSVGIWDWVIPTNEVFWSDRFREIIRAKGEVQHTYEAWVQRLHPEDKKPTVDMLMQHLERRTPYDAEYRLLRDDGTYVWLHARGKAVWNEKGTPLRMVGSIEDITSRIASEDKITDEASRLQAIMNTMLDGLITIDSRGMIQSFNSSAHRIFGYEQEEVLGRNVKMLMPDPYHSEHDSYIANYHRTGIGKIIGTGREVTARRKDGTIFPMDLGISSFEINREKCFVGIVRDITERKQQEAFRQELLNKLVASNTELERFAYIASHDMQEPIRMITNFSAIIAQDYGNLLDDTAREYLGLVIDSGIRMRDLVDDLLAYSRLGTETRDPAAFDANEALGGALQNLQELIREKHAEITQTTLPTMHGNPIQFLRLLQNLVANGIKYQQSGNTPRIHVSSEDSGQEWLIHVKDNGLGIREEFVQQVFQPFRRLHRWEAIKGTGLGLSICKRIVENHGGRIWVESTPGTGSTFSFSISKNMSQSSEAA